MGHAGNAWYREAPLYTRLRDLHAQARDVSSYAHQFSIGWEIPVERVQLGDSFGDEWVIRFYNMGGRLNSAIILFKEGGRFTHAYQMFFRERGGRFYVKGGTLLHLALLSNSPMKGVSGEFIERLPLDAKVKNAVYWIAENAKRELETQGLPVDPFTDLFGVPFYAVFNDIVELNDYSTVVFTEDSGVFTLGNRLFKYRLRLHRDDVESEVHLHYEEKQCAPLLVACILSARGAEGGSLKVAYSVEREGVTAFEYLGSMEDVYIDARQFGRELRGEAYGALLEDLLWRTEALYGALQTYVYLTYIGLTSLSRHGLAVRVLK